MSMDSSRREMLKLATAGMTVLAANRPARAGETPEGAIAVRVTAGEKRYAEGEAVTWRPRQEGGAGIEVDAAQKHQDILGFGAAFTDAACYVIHQLGEERERALLEEFFAPENSGFSVCRVPIGSSDYARGVYSFDEGAPDPELKRFSIAHDRAYILPVLKQSRRINPELFLLASPWSPPGWMKANGSMLGGNIRVKYFDAYARYFERFLEEYAAAGVTVNAITSQNEVDTDQDGRMPACIFSQENEIAFVAEHLGPLLERRGLSTKIWILDHNYNLWGRAICELDDPQLNRYVDGVAWHGYVGEVTAMTRVHEAHPNKHAYWTEGGPDLDDPAYATAWTKWSETFTGILANWARCIIGWNLALDENGKPNIGPFRCGGLVTIHSGTKQITRSGMYWALSHYAKAIRRGAKRIGSTGARDGISHVAFLDRDKKKILMLTNRGEERDVAVRAADREATVRLPKDSIVTLSWN